MAAEFEDKNFKLKKFSTSASGDFVVTDEVLQYFRTYGCVVVTGLLNKDQIHKLETILMNPKAAESLLGNAKQGMEDGKGRTVKLVLWTNIDNGYTGKIASCENVAATWDSLLGERTYNYHSKLILKDANAETAGVFNWHQDYGYWYGFGYLTPDMGTTWISIDRADRNNGCLKIIPGSHKLGRVEHEEFVKNEVRAQDERVEQILRHFAGWVYVELDPGDAIFFHSNILHRSEANTSGNRRWAFVTAVSTERNHSVKAKDPQFNQFQQMKNSALNDDAEIPTDCDLVITPEDLQKVWT